MIGPGLDHFSTLVKQDCAVVYGSHAALFVRKLQLDCIRFPPEFIQQSGGDYAKAVTNLLSTGITKPSQCRIDGIIAHGSAAREKRWENISTAAGVRLKFTQDRDRLFRERDDVRILHLHFFRRDTPSGLGAIKIKFLPLAPTQFSGPNDYPRT